jgi:hypothetical protein
MLGAVATGVLAIVWFVINAIIETVQGARRILRWRLRQSQQLTEKRVMKSPKEDEPGQSKPNERPVLKEHTVRIEVDRDVPVQKISEALTQAIGEILANEAMVFPVHVAALACNGSGHIMRFVPRDDGPGGEVEFLAEHQEGRGWMLPIHALIMDSDGHTARVIVAQREVGGWADKRSQS